MDREGLIRLLKPFIDGKVPKDYRWHRITASLARRIPDSELDETIGELSRMFHSPFNPDSRPESEIPGAHGLVQVLTARRREIIDRD